MRGQRSCHALMQLARQMANTLDMHKKWKTKNISTCASNLKHVQPKACSVIRDRYYSTFVEAIFINFTIFINFSGRQWCNGDMYTYLQLQTSTTIKQTSTGRSKVATKLKYLLHMVCGPRGTHKLRNIELTYFPLRPRPTTDRISMRNKTLTPLTDIHHQPCCDIYGRALGQENTKIEEGIDQNTWTCARFLSGR